MSTAYALLNTNFVDAQEKQQAMAQAGQLIDWVRNRFGRGPFFGAWGIDEQGFPDGRGCCSRSGEGSHTARWAAINALYFARTNDGQAREDAFRSLNYATYFAGGDGRISCCGSDYHHVYWFSDGYSDYLRHFTAAMGAVPDFAPAGEDHLVHSTSVVKKIRYAPGQIGYETFFAQAEDTITLSFEPALVKAGSVRLNRRDDLAGDGYTLGVLADGNRILRIRHSGSEQISISVK